jgi:hypothetical protein
MDDLIVLIGCLILFGIGFSLGIFLYRAHKKIKQLQTDRNDLIKEKAKISDQVRLKGIEVDQLKKELDKYKNTEIKVALTLPEKKIIMNALESSWYKARIQDPATKRYIRIIYNTLRKKIKESIKE